MGKVDRAIQTFLLGLYTAVETMKDGRGSFLGYGFSERNAN